MKKIISVLSLFILLLFANLFVYSENNKASAIPSVAYPNEIDKWVDQKLKERKIESSPICTDDIFIRRLYLSLTGRIPGIEATRHFIHSTEHDKRSKLIDKLLESEEYVDFQALKWGDILRCKSEYPSNLWPNAVQAYTRWMKENIRKNTPFNEFAKSLIVSTGSNFRKPEVNFYRAFQKRNAQNIAESVALIFLGTRSNELKNTRQDYSFFFSQIKYKKTDEWKEEIVYIKRDSLLFSQSFIFPNGTKIEVLPNSDLRSYFADWLTSKENKQFAEVIVNRIWSWLMGTGIVNEVDDFRESNPPSNPELLRFLADDLIRNNFDLKHTFRTILNSQTFQRSSIPNGSNAKDERYFSHYKINRLSAEELVDAIGDVTGNPDTYFSRVPEPFTFLPKDTRAVQLEDGTVSTPILEMFGRPSRDLSFESERNNNITNKQIMHLLNSSQITDKIEKSKFLKELTTNAKNDNELIENIYLLTLSRFPTSDEIATIKKLCTENKTSRENCTNDLVWALLNTKEFLFNH